MECKNCKKKHDGTFGSGIYCSRSCANSRNHSKATKCKISKSVQEHADKNPKPKQTNICEKCGKKFEGYVRKGRKAHCDKCKRKTFSLENPKSIMELSSRTVSKILQRANVPCAICGWDEASRDLHHIVPKKEGGTDDHDNLIVVCPNDHRKAHEGKIPIEVMKEHCLSNTFQNWEIFYNN